MALDPIEQATQDEMTRRRFEVIDMIRRASEDWRLNRAIAQSQAFAVMEELHQVRDDRVLIRITDAILAENRKHYDEIQAALAELRKDGMTDEEIEELLR